MSSARGCCYVKVYSGGGRGYKEKGGCCYTEVLAEDPQTANHGPAIHEKHIIKHTTLLNRINGWVTTVGPRWDAFNAVFLSFLFFSPLFPTFWLQTVTQASTGKGTPITAWECMGVFQKNPEETSLFMKVITPMQSAHESSIPRRITNTIWQCTEILWTAHKIFTFSTIIVTSIHICRPFLGA